MDNIPTEPGQSFARVHWQLPVPTDNSNEPLTLTGLRPPQRINVGKKHITYRVTDSSGLSRSCVFFIHIKGTNCISISLIKKKKPFLVVTKLFRKYHIIMLESHMSLQLDDSSGL